VPIVALLDTNVWVSAFLKPTGPPGRLVSRWMGGEFETITSLPQLTETADVLRRPRLTRRFGYPQEEVEAFLRLIVARATVVPISGELVICRDPDDNEILEAAIRGKSRYLVTRDDDLKRDLDLIVVARRHGVRVVSVRQFLRILSRHGRRRRRPESRPSGPSRA
jgi:putative PIN family toxin of toxin-antitoxin system